MIIFNVISLQTMTVLGHSVATAIHRNASIYTCAPSTTSCAWFAQSHYTRMVGIKGSYN